MFILSTKKIFNSKKMGSLYCKGDIEYEKDNVFALKGDFFTTNKEEIKKELKRNIKSITKKNIGEYTFTHYDVKKDKVSIISDKFGRDVVFYYLDKENLIISDDFWEIVRNLKITFADTNVQAMKESLMLCLPLQEDTFIKNMKTIPAAGHVTFDLKTLKINIERYWSYKLSTSKGKSHEEKIVGLEKAFDESIDNIKNKYDNKTVFGVGVSGGLDSKIVAHYAKAVHLPLKSFIIGQRRPHFFFKSRDHKNADEICEILNIPHKEVSYNNVSYEEKMRVDIEKNMVTLSQITKYVRKLPRFDVLLTGSGDMYVGSKIPANIERLNRDELAMEIFKRRGLLRKPKAPLKRFLEITKIIPLKDEIQPLIKGMLRKEDFSLAKKRLKEFLSEKEKGKTNYEIYQDYVIAVQGSKNKFGAFESMCGEKPSHTIYSELVFEEALTWSESDHIDRKILKDFVNEKLPELAKVKLQNWKPSTKKKFGFNFASFLSLSGFIIRGWGVTRYTEWTYSRKFKRFAKKTFKEPSPWFDEIFDKYLVWQAYKEKTIDCRIFWQLLKLRVFLEKVRRMS